MSQIWRFADCEIDLDTRELRRAGQVVDLEPRVFDLLAFLLANRAHAVSRDEMLATVWPGMVVTDSAFNQAVLKARRATGDDGQAQRVIRTVSRRGYRFVAEVGEGASGKPPPAGETASDPAPRRVLLRWSVVAAVGLLLALAAGLHRTATEPQPRHAVLPVALVSNSEEHAWVKLGLMALIDAAFERQAIDTIAPSAVLATLEQTGSRDADNEVRAERLLRSHGALRILGATATAEASGWRLDYTVYEADRAPHSAQVRAATPAALADAVVRDMVSVADTSNRANPPLADELHARGLAANLEGDSRAAAEYFRVALREQPERAWTRYELALAQRQLGQTDLARDAFSTLIEEASATADTRLELAARKALGILEWRGGRFDAAEAQLREALALADEFRRGPEQAALALNLGILASSRSQFAIAHEHYLRALTRYREIGWRKGEASVYNSLGVLAWKRGRHDESARMHQRALDIRRELGVRGDLAASLNNLGTIAVLRGRWQQAESLYTEALELRRELGDGGGVARSTTNLADLRLWQGRFAEADRLALEGLDVARRHDYRPALREACLLAVEIALRRRAAALAEQRLGACELTDSDPAPAHLAHALQREELAALRGTPSAIEPLLESTIATGDPEAQARVQLAAARIATIRQDDTAHETHLLRGLDLAREAAHPGLTARAAAELGRVWLAAQRIDDVEPLLAEAALWPDYAPGVVLAGLYAEARGDRDRAHQELLRAQTLAGEAWRPEFAAALARVDAAAGTTAR